MEGWSNIMYDVANSFTIFSVLYFIVCVFIGSFFMIQLTLAVIKAKFSGTQQNKEEVVEEAPAIVMEPAPEPTPTPKQPDTEPVAVKTQAQILAEKIRNKTRHCIRF